MPPPRSSSAPARFVWVYLEMTGLEPETHAIIEVAMVITGADLKPLCEYDAVVWQPEEQLLRMEPIVREMHTENGLLKKVRASTKSLRVVEKDLGALLAEHCGFGEGVLAGNSIHTDRRFLIHYMPLVDRYLHYRMLDVTSLKVLARAWYPGATEFKKAKSDHTALSDIKESLRELAHYKATLFRSNPA